MAALQQHFIQQMRQPPQVILDTLPALGERLDVVSQFDKKLEEERKKAEEEKKEKEKVEAEKAKNGRNLETSYFFLFFFAQTPFFQISTSIIFSISFFLGVFFFVCDMFVILSFEDQKERTRRRCRATKGVS